MNKITYINGDLLTAILAGGKIVFALSRESEDKTKIAHFVTVEMPKDVIIENFQFGEGKYWKYLTFECSSDMPNWWHAGSNNLTKRENEKKIWGNWGDAKILLNCK